jgi:aldehyde:ferredoxin oxidoreductase
MGTNLGVETVEDVAYLNERCNELGMDTISLGGVAGFAIEAHEKGALTLDDLGGTTIEWGNTEALAQLIHTIAHRKTRAGDVLAEGVACASDTLGGHAGDYAVHVKGLEVPGYDPRGAFGMGLAYATSDRGGCHQRAWTAKAETTNPYLNRFSFEKKAKMVKEIQDERAAFFSLVLCDFAPISEQNCVDMWNLASGFDHTVESYLCAGERIWNLIRLFNLREGLNPADDTLPPRFFKDSFTRGPAKKTVIPRDAFQQSLAEYYALRGWDDRGVPTMDTLTRLGLTQYASFR